MGVIWAVGLMLAFLFVLLPFIVLAIVATNKSKEIKQKNFSFSLVAIPFTVSLPITFVLLARVINSFPTREVYVFSSNFKIIWRTDIGLLALLGIIFLVISFLSSRKYRTFSGHICSLASAIFYSGITQTTIGIFFAETFFKFLGFQITI